MRALQKTNLRQDRNNAIFDHWLAGEAQRIGFFIFGRIAVFETLKDGMPIPSISIAKKCHLAR